MVNLDLQSHIYLIVSGLTVLNFLLPKSLLWMILVLLQASDLKIYGLQFQIYKVMAF